MRGASSADLSAARDSVWPNSCNADGRPSDETLSSALARGFDYSTGGCSKSGARKSSWKSPRERSLADPFDKAAPQLSPASEKRKHGAPANRWRRGGGRDTPRCAAADPGSVQKNQTSRATTPRNAGVFPKAARSLTRVYYAIGALASPTYARSRSPPTQACPDSGHIQLTLVGAIRV